MIFKNRSLNRVPLIILIQNCIIPNSNIPSQQHLILSHGQHECFTGAGGKNILTYAGSGVHARRRPSPGAAMMKWKFVTGLPKRVCAVKRPCVQPAIDAYVCERPAQQRCIHAKQANSLRCGEGNRASLWKSGEAEDFMLRWLLCGLTTGEHYKNICGVVYSTNLVRYKECLHVRLY